MRKLLALLFIGSVVAPGAHAAIYENTLEVADEDDLFDLVQRGDISDETADTLLELIREGVDLNAGTREQLYDLPGLTYENVDAIIAYRTSKGRIDDPTELVGANVLTAEQLIQIAPFIRLDPAGPRLPVGGKIRAQTRFSPTDNVPPPGLLSARLRGPANLTAGFMAFTTRRLVATPTYDPVTDQLLTDGFGYHVHLPRVYAQWSPGKAKIVAGTFTIGFGERLTLDNTRRITPRGIYLVDDFIRPQDSIRTCKVSTQDEFSPVSSGCVDGQNLYITPDYDWRETFRGVAAQIEDVKVGKEASVSLYGFASYQTRSIYQYELYDRRYCDDPTQDNLTDCKAPAVYFEDRTSKLVYSTLPYLFDELTAGGHVTFRPIYALTFGVTGYGAIPFFRPEDIRLDFQEWSRYPSGGPFGAIGIDAKASFRGFNFFIEATRSFDARKVTTQDASGGGFGIEQRTTYSLKKQEFELSLRYYDTGFGTPYARPISSPDELDGLRARNEAGARLRWLGRLDDFELRARADFWVNPYPIEGTTPAGITNLYALARADFLGWKSFQPGVWVDIRNRNLPSNQHGGCSSAQTVYTEGDPFLCNGDLYRVAARALINVHRKYLQVIVQGWLTWRDYPRYDDRFANDVQGWLELRSQPLDFLQLRARTRYLFRDISDNTYQEHNAYSYVEAAFLIAKTARLALRYDLLAYLDQRESTLTRVPNPEHRFQLDVRVNF